MKDRELLELAAKAAGLGGGPFDFDPRTGWNPLENDGDALRLAVELKIDVRVRDMMVYVGQSVDQPQVKEHVATNADTYAATRRAIVRAAAEMAKATA